MVSKGRYNRHQSNFVILINYSSCSASCRSILQYNETAFALLCFEFLFHKYPAFSDLEGEDEKGKSGAGSDRLYSSLVDYSIK